MPKVSVILSTYNRAYILMSAVRSVLEQSYTDFELIIVDDGSTDATESLVRGLQDARVVYVRHEKNMGLATGRNTGLAHAKGEYIAFQDSDDIWERDKLARHVPMLDGAPESVGAVYGMLEKKLKDGSTIIYPGAHVERKEGNVHVQMLKHNFITMQVALVRASVFGEVGMFDPDIYSLEDWDFWMRCTQKYEVRFDPWICVHAVVMGDSLTSNRPLRLDDRARAYTKNKHAFEKHPDIQETILVNIAKGYLYANKQNLARQYAKEALAIRFSVRGAGAYIASRLPRQIWRCGVRVFAIFSR